MTHIVFRCDASQEIGIGHVMRCLSLAHFISQRNIKITFLVSLETIEAVPALKNSPFCVCHEWGEEKVDWLIIDHYQLGEGYEIESRKWAKKIMVIDDLASRLHDCDLLLDQTFLRKEEDYLPFVPENCRLLLGSDYALLREEFRSLCHLGREIDFRNPNHIFISFGGLNHKKATEKTLNWLSGYNFKALDIHVVTGGGDDIYSSILEAANGLMKETKHKVTIHCNVQNMADMMREAHLCIGSGGTTSWERCCLGLPTLTLELADNQKTVLDKLNEFGALLNLGEIENVTQEKFLESFASLLQSEDALKIMSEKAQSFNDGRGVQRVACYLIPPSLDKQGSEITVRMAREEDCNVLYEWQSQDNARTYARSPETPVYEDHVQWFHESLNNPARSIFIVEKDNLPCAMGRLDLNQNLKQKLDHDIRGEAYEVSILVSDEYQGLGVGGAVLEQLSKMVGDAVLFAEINPQNMASQAIFKKADYIQLDETWYIFENR